MLNLSNATGLALACALFVHSPHAGARQAPGDGLAWLPTFGAEPGTDGYVAELALLDVGTGPALYAGGDFTMAGGVPASNVARWDGSAWSDVGGGVGGGPVNYVNAICSFDDGTGPALYVGGRFATAGGVAADSIARFDGSTWTALSGGLSSVFTGVQPLVSALIVHDDGSGPALFVGGTFTLAGSTPVLNIAKWDGTQWFPVGSGVGYPSSGVRDLEVFDDGSGPRLFAGGQFNGTGFDPVPHHVVAWDGATWTPLPSGPDGIGSSTGTYVQTLRTFDDGTGPALFVGGDFSEAGGAPASDVARWDGSAWSAVGTLAVGQDLNLGVRDLEVWDDGSGPHLVAAGVFAMQGPVFDGVPRQWNGSTWAKLGNGPVGTSRALAAWDQGAGQQLYTGGDFENTGPFMPKAVNDIARWDGSAWSAVPESTTAVSGGEVRALADFTVGGTPLLVAGGTFVSAGGSTVNAIAAWDGSGWSPLGNPFSDVLVNALLAWDDGSGEALYAGGFRSSLFQGPGHLLRWDGASFSGVGTDGPTGQIHSLCVFDDGSGPALYAGGAFVEAGGGPAKYIARWDGVSWTPVGTGLSGPAYAMVVHDDGTGPQLYAAGGITMAGGVVVNGIGRWNGSTWSAVGSGVGNTARSLAVFDDGSGPALYVGRGGNSPGLGFVRRWDGSTWAPVGEDDDFDDGDTVFALTSFDDRAGPALFAAVGPGPPLGPSQGRVARLTGGQWVDQGAGLDHQGLALHVSSVAGEAELYVGGTFRNSTAGDAALARYGPASVLAVTGCAGNPATLASSSPVAPLGGSLNLSVEGGQAIGGAALLFAGASGLDLGGCGLALPGLGEWLLSLPPLLLASGDLASGGANFAVAIPDDPQLAGATVWLQAVAIDLGLPAPIELTDALAATLGG
ncbi:hypothetical protein [Engelhardtia mirabilis]|uniref:Cortical protein marker for cell polarity n=1 Tax=Engelhardtia mirabilis TaxID=2528011 RepID=A0A518BRM5_9BACT|nr:Cortical protein marker for cell polarity [Planctomycetes bacterium Pla133]QDV03954.1 Cortical protein marker for cell polarity [Planctomycetes bacterium Pla86]